MHGIRALVLITSFMLFGSTVYSADWSNWRGPGQNGVSLETNLPERWSPDASKPDNNLVWRAPYGGRTTPIVQNDGLIFIKEIHADITFLFKPSFECKWAAR